jgi:hypothetical protein
MKVYQPLPYCFMCLRKSDFVLLYALKVNDTIMYVCQEDLIIYNLHHSLIDAIIDEQ